MEKTAPPLEVEVPFAVALAASEEAEAACVVAEVACAVEATFVVAAEVTFVVAAEVAFVVAAASVSVAAASISVARQVLLLKAVELLLDVRVLSFQSF